MVQREVRIGHEDAFLLLAEPEVGREGEPRSVLAKLELPDLRAGAKVWLGQEASLADFFDALAREWRGWEGVQGWAAYEGGLRLEASTDRMGHVSLHVKLRQYSTHGWSAAGDVPLDAGQLEGAARDVRAIFAAG